MGVMTESFKPSIDPILSETLIRKTSEVIMHIMDDLKRNAGMGSLGQVFIFLALIIFCTSSEDTGLKVEKLGTAPFVKVGRS